jgi:hypothetical protein
MKYLAPSITQLDSQFLSKNNTGMGNVLFQLASAYGLAKDSGRELSTYYLKQFTDKIRRLYNFNHDEVIYKRFLDRTDKTVEPTESVYDIGNKRYDPGVLASVQKASAPCVKLEGYLECPLHFDKYRNEILDLINPGQFDELLASRIPALFDPSYTPISVHIRNGYDAIKVNYGAYKTAVEMIKLFVPNPYFFIFIDYPDRLPFNPYEIGMTNVQLVHFEQDYLDLFCLSHCAHHIASFSTFCWWGAYLCKNPDKKIFIPRDAAEYCMNANGLKEEEYLRDYFLGYASIFSSF